MKFSDYYEWAIRRGWLWAFLAAFFLYAPSLRYQFTYDDVLIIKDNPRIRNLAEPRAYLWTSYWDSPGQNREYRPLAIASYALNYAVHGVNPVGYRVVNLILHAAVSAAIALFLRSLFAAPGLALLAALLFAVHPIHVEVVAGVVGRAELMASLGFIVALQFCLKSLRSGSESRRWGWACLVFLAAVLSVGSKENGLTILPAALALPFILRSSSVASKKGTQVSFADAVPSLIACGLATGIYLGLRVIVLGGLSGPPGQMIFPYDNPLVELSGLPRTLSAVKLLARYALMLVWPFNPSPDYSYGAIPLVLDIADPSWMIGGALIPVFFGVGWFLRGRPASFFGVYLFFITFVITSNIFFPIGTILAERLLYLPSLGFCIFVADVALLVASRMANPRSPAILACASIAVCVIFAAQTLRYLPVWKSNTTLFAYMAERVPGSARAQLNYALVLLEQEKWDEGQERLERSLQIMPHQPLALGKMGFLKLRVNDLAGAEADLERARSMAPDDPDVIMTLARVYAMRSQFDEAMNLYRNALVHNPKSPKLQRDFGLLLAERGDPREAIRYLETFLAANSVIDDQKVFLTLGDAYKKLGEIEASNRYYARAKATQRPPTTTRALNP